MSIIVLFRHGEGRHNIERFFDCKPDSIIGLTENGKDMVKESAINLKNEINTNDIQIYSSPLLRARETADIISKILNVDNIIIDNRLKEVQMGTYNGKNVSEFPYDIYDIQHGHTYEGENYDDVDNRIISFFDDINKNKNILIVSHALPIREMIRIITGIPEKIKTSNYFIY